jgi:ABC-type amino acid transport substrate-binding protein
MWLLPLTVSLALPMSSSLRFLFALALACACTAPHAAPGELVLLAPANHAMPIAAFADGVLVGGILKEIDEAIGARIGRTVRHITVPSRRVSLVLAQGEADGVCYVQPNWIDGSFEWSAPMIPNGGVVLAHAEAPVIREVAQLRSQRVGTVAGYRYARFDQELGAGFVRDDAPSTQHNLLKLAAGRTRYALVDQATALYLRRHGKLAGMRIDLSYDSFRARCAFSQQSKVPLAQLNQAVDSLIADGSVERIMARYR